MASVLNSDTLVEYVRRQAGAVDTLEPSSAISQLRENAVLVDCPVDDDRGGLLGMEPEATRDLHSFVTECHRIIHDGSE